MINERRVILNPENPYTPAILEVVRVAGVCAQNAGAPLCGFVMHLDQWLIEETWKACKPKDRYAYVR